MLEDPLRFELLRELTRDPATSQRGLASRLGVSVGKINFCLRALVEKGWVKAKNFQRSDNKRAYAYLLTPAGVAAKLRLTRDFLATKEQEFRALHLQLESLRNELEMPHAQHAPDGTGSDSQKR